MTANPLPPIPPMSATTGMAAPGGPSRLKPIDPVKVLREHMPLLIFSGVIALVLGVGTWAMLHLFMQRYSSEALMKVKPPMETALQTTLSEMYQGSMDAVEKELANQVAMMTSDEVLRATLDHPVVQSTQWYASFTDPKERLESFKEDILSVYPYRESTLILANVTTPAKEDPQRILTQLIQVYLNRLGQSQRAQLESDRAVFVQERERIDQARRNLQDQISAFSKEHQIDSLNAQHTSTAQQHALLLQDMYEVKGELADAEQSYQNLVQNAQAGGTIEITPNIKYQLDLSPEILEINRRENTLREQLASTEARLGPRHYMAEQLRNQLRALVAERDILMDRKARELQQLQIDNAAQSVEGLRAKVAELQEQVTEAHNRMIDLNSLLTRYESLQGDLEQKKEDLALVDQRLQEIRVYMQRASRVEVLNPATEPEMSFPKPELIIPGVTVLVMALITGAIFLRELLDQRVKTPADVKLLPNVDLLGVLPDASEDPSGPRGIERIVEKAPSGLMAESFRQTRTAILSRMDRRGYKTLLVVGAQPRCGVSAVVHNLATSMAFNGRNVLIIDANLRRPAHHRLIGDADGRGLVDVIRDEVPADQVIRRVEGLSVSVLPSGDATDTPPEMLEGAAFRGLLSQLETRYDVVLIDAPPALLTSDSQLLSKHVDAIALVVWAQSDKRGMVERMLRQLDGQRADVLGVVLNGVQSSAGGYFRKSYREFYRYQESDAATNGSARNGDRGRGDRLAGSDRRVPEPVGAGHQRPDSPTSNGG